MNCSALRRCPIIGIKDSLGKMGSLMKILQIHYIDKANGTYGGGGAIAMHRLHISLRKAGITSLSLCFHKTSSDSIKLPRMKKLDYGLKKITSRFGLNDINCLSTFMIKRMGAYNDANILHLHCIHGGFFNYLALPWLTASKPAVFTLHDMWPFTGHCAYSYDCERWETGCGKCPYPMTYPPVRRDATRIEWRLKDWVYAHSNIVVVCPSHWMTEQARQSMLNCFPIHQIPYGIDTDVYEPLDPEQCRFLLGIPASKKVIGFVAHRLSESRKGGDLLLKALQSLPESLKAEVLLLTLGANESNAFAEAVGIPTLNLGYIDNDRLKAIVYSAADLFVMPTRADNLPLVLMESMACGTPMVSFRIGGVPDLIRPGITGYLAEPENAKDLSDGIVQLLEDESLYSFMSEQCRAITLKEYPSELQAQRYIELYRLALHNRAA
jgi:glycosyltransferase involved in cell wall biosynthesis